MTEQLQIYDTNNTLVHTIPKSGVKSPWIFERVNGEYYFDFELHDRAYTDSISNGYTVVVDSDKFIITQIKIQHGSTFSVKYSCEHISYLLNFHNVESDELEEEITYTGSVYGIIPEMLDGTEFSFIFSDDTPGGFEFKTKKRGIRSRILEFCEMFGFEAHFRNYEVAIQNRRGTNHGLEILLGKNVKDLTETRTLQFNGSEDRSFDITFVDLNYVTDLDGNQLEDDEFHLGDTCKIYSDSSTYFETRGIAIGYNPFERVLPEIELGSPRRLLYDGIKDIVEGIAYKPPSGGGGGGGGGVIYGVRIDETNSNPETALTYTDDAVGFTPAYMDFASDTFNYGSWEDKFPFNQIKPCLFKDDAVVGYLKKNDYTQFEDGSPADITSGDAGDVMVELPKIWWKFERIGTDLYVRLASYAVDATFKCLAHTRGAEESDKIYIAAYLGFELNGKLRSLSNKIATANKTIGQFRGIAHVNGVNYEQMTYYQLLMLQVLYIIMFKNRNSQAALGKGYVENNTSASVTGTTNKKGLFFGENTGKEQIKFCGVEDFYGNLRVWVDGIYSDVTRNILINTQNFNDSGSGYINYGEGHNSNLSGQLTVVQGGTETGFIAKNTGGSVTTHYADTVYLNSSGLAIFGGYWAGSSNAGAFNLEVDNSSTYKSVTISARLTGWEV